MQTASTLIILPIIFVVSILGNESMFKAIFDNCIISEGATNEDLKTLLSGDLPETYTEKCLTACLSENFGAVSKKFIEFNE